MKIGNLIEQLRADRPAVGADRARNASSGATTGPAGAVTDTVALSAASRHLAAGETARAAGDFDADKVAAVRAAIAQGTFGVDAGRVADRMIEHAGDLLGGAARS